MSLAASAPRSRKRAGEAAWLHGLATAAMVVWQVGVYVDVWYHARRGFEIESFFTWAHALLYGGWALAGFVPVAFRLFGRTPLPREYRIFLLGVALFGFGGAIDLAWHTAFGFEVGQETVLSPSHLWLALAFTVAAFGLLAGAARWRAEARAGEEMPTATGDRSAHVPSGSTWITPADLPTVLALAMLLRVTGFYLIYVGPLTIDFASGGAAVQSLPGYAGIDWNTSTAQIAGTGGILLHSVLLVLFLVGPLRALRLPVGSIAVIMLYDALLVVPATNQWLALPAVVVSALAGEALWLAIRRGGLGGPDGMAGYWLLGALVPLVQAALLMVAAGLSGTLVWTVHIWAGVPVVAGILGLTAAMLMVPPRVESGE